MGIGIRVIYDCAFCGDFQLGWISETALKKLPLESTQKPQDWYIIMHDRSPRLCCPKCYDPSMTVVKGLEEVFKQKPVKIDEK